MGLDSGEVILPTTPRSSCSWPQRKLGVGWGWLDSRARVLPRARVPEVQESYICSPTVMLGRKAGSFFALAIAKRMLRMFRNKLTLNLIEGEGQGELGSVRSIGKSCPKKPSFSLGGARAR